MLHIVKYDLKDKNNKIIEVQKEFVDGDKANSFLFEIKKTSISKPIIEIVENKK